MARSSGQRGSLLSSVFMVMLATVATGMLALIGFQALPDGVVPSTFGGGDHGSRNVDVSESPSAVTVRPTTAGTSGPVATPSVARTSDAPRPQETRETTSGGNDTGSGTNTGGGNVTKPVRTTEPEATKKPTPTPTTKPPSPTASQTTQAPSPAPTCGSGRKPRCSTPAPTQDAQAAPSAAPSTRSSVTGTSTTSSYGGEAATAEPASAKKKGGAASARRQGPRR